MQADEFDGPIRNSRASARRIGPNGEGRAPLRAGTGENGTRQIPV
jgi:hypothetical protein